MEKAKTWCLFPCRHFATIRDHDWNLLFVGLFCCFAVVDSLGQNDSIPLEQCARGTC